MPVLGMRVSCVALLLLSCCAFVSVPSRFEMGGVYANGEVAHKRPSGVREHEEARMFHFRGGLHPLQAFNRLQKRSFDIGAGYLYESFQPTKDTLKSSSGGWFGMVTAAISRRVG